MPDASEQHAAVGIAVCDGNIHAVIRRPGRADTTADGRMLPDKSLQEVLETVAFKRCGNYTPKVIGFSTHDSADLIDQIAPPKDAENAKIVPVSPTAATMAGLKFWNDKARQFLQNGYPTTPRPTDVAGHLRPDALLKIGPRRLSWASDGDLLPTYFSAADVTDLCPTTRELAEFLGADLLDDPLQLIGNQGWYNVARMVDKQNLGGVTPSNLTRTMMDNVTVANVVSLGRGRAYARIFAQHLCGSTMRFDPFAEQVSRLMRDMLGHIIAYVTSLRPVNSLAVQCNWLATHRGNTHPIWEPVSLSMAFCDANIPPRLPVALIGPHPEWAEAYGAIEVASRLSKTAIAAA